jgi:pimeloyl-ACP methyl ester carboxylesterase
MCENEQSASSFKTLVSTRFRTRVFRYFCEFLAFLRWEFLVQKYFFSVPLAFLEQRIDGNRMLGNLTPLDVDARGLRVRFHEYGEGRPLLLVHDFLLNRHTWDDVLVQLGKHFRVFAVDLPGFGESERPSPSKFGYELPAFADTLLDVTAALGLQRISILGHGLGGSIALALAAKHPSVVENLMTVAPFVYPCNHGRLIETSALPLVGRHFFKQFLGETSFRKMACHYGESAKVPEERIRLAFQQFDTPAARESAHATLVSMLDTRALIAMLPRVSTRTLIMWGREDPLCPALHARNLSRQIVSARLEVLATGHSPHEESPGPFAALVQGFLMPPQRRRLSTRPEPQT